MKFVVEIETMYLEEEDLNAGIKRAIINDVSRQVVDQLTDKHGAKIEKQIKETVESEFLKKMDERIEKILNTETIDGKEDGKKIDEWMAEQFRTSGGWRNPKDAIANKAKAIAEEMKQRYDLLFASQIVNKLNEQGLLKEGAADTLLKKPSQKSEDKMDNLPY